MDDERRDVEARDVGDGPVVDLVLYMPMRRDTALPVPVAAADAADTASEAAEGGAASSPLPLLSALGVVLFDDEERALCSSCRASR